MKIKSGDVVTLSELGIIALNNTKMSINERINLTRIMKNGGKVRKVFDTHSEVIPFTEEGIAATEYWICPNFKLASR
ncbi:MAG: hypothetical protein PWP51_1725 [Clostridiales bacterium]|jgi:hypothetical protein|nr:hypothetical protein [Clostridiales bacterium]MDN5299172.1 hypothetical protein [Clostridiales bacterium]